MFRIVDKASARASVLIKQVCVGPNRAYVEIILNYFGGYVATLPQTGRQVGSVGSFREHWGSHCAVRGANFLTHISNHLYTQLSLTTHYLYIYIEFRH